MQFSELLTDRYLRKIVTQGTPMFPCSFYDCDVGKRLYKEVPWHWHEELELSVMYEGTAAVNCGESSFEVRAGEGFFVNSNVLHSVHPLGGGDCKYRTFVFHHSLLSGAPESVFEQKYMLPILNSSKLETFCFTPEIPWQAEALNRICAAFDAFEKAEFGYELQVRENLSHLWYLLAVHTKAIISSGASISSVDAERIKRMLAFIHENYTRRITVAEIAFAADIGESECYRCFKRIMNQSPVERLKRFRVHRAANLLAESAMDVTEISYAVGFNSPSYFTKVFGELMHTTPREYRKLSKPKGVKVPKV